MRGFAERASRPALTLILKRHRGRQTTSCAREVAGSKPAVTILIVPAKEERPASATLVGREEEALERLNKPRRGGDEVSGSRCEHPLGVKGDGQRIADALDPRRVTP
jgi:hypothetical protein